MKIFIYLLVPGILLLVHPAFGQNTVLTSSTALPGGGTGDYNVVVGPGNSYPNASNAKFNVFIGDDAGRSITTGSFNFITGYWAGYHNTTGRDNAFTGAYAGYYNTTGSYNAFTGSQAGFLNTTGINNTFTGIRDGYSNTTGVENSFSGSRAGHSNTIGGLNSFTGVEAGYSNTTGSFNSFTGYTAGYSNTTGDHISFTGYKAGYLNTTGRENAFTGYWAGLSNTTGNWNSFFGTSADATGPNLSNLQRATALGYNAKVAVNNGLVLGDTASVKVGIGTAYPNQKLTLRGNMNFVAYDNSLRLKNQPFLHFNEHESLALGLGSEIPSGAEGTLVLGSETTQVLVPSGAEGSSGLVLSQYAGQPNIGQVLTVNEYGKVVLTQPRIQVASVADWSDKVFEPGYALRPLGEVEVFVKKNKHLPGIPSAETMVAEGIESAAFNAKLLEKIEELTLYVVALEKRLNELEKK